MTSLKIFCVFAERYTDLYATKIRLAQVFEKYNELRMRHDGEWKISQIELISVALACENIRGDSS